MLANQISFYSYITVLRILAFCVCVCVCECVRLSLCTCLNAQRVCRKKNCPIVCHPLQSIRSTVRVGGWKIAPLVLICRFRFLNSVIEDAVLRSSGPTWNKLKWSSISWPEFMVALNFVRAWLPFPFDKTYLINSDLFPSKHYGIIIHAASGVKSGIAERIHSSVYWPGVRSCHRGWHTSAKSSCPHGGWWRAIWPSGSSASPLRCADNPGGKTRRNNKGETG